MTTKKNGRVFFLALLALGIVYGDIGTSVLYAVNEVFFPEGRSGIPVNEANVLGVMSLILWTLNIIITIKYVMLVPRADHHGEGGMFALLAKLSGKSVSALGVRLTGLFTVLLILASGLLAGVGALTPAISVTSAVEGLEVITPVFKPWVVPIVIFILTGLFWFQKRGTAGVGMVFGPIVILWIFTIGTIGVLSITTAPHVLKAFWPGYAINFLAKNGILPVLHTLGAVMLVVTGGEAMYADLGHVGKKAIRITWPLVVLGLMLNYLGQGAYLLSGQPVTEGNVFFSMVPLGEIGKYGMVILAAMAAIIASQALISGFYSLVAQANAMGLMPRVLTVHTSSEEKGQIYQPTVNWLLYLWCISLVLVFQTASNLASAYGFAIAGIMTITSFSLIPVAQREWKWHWMPACLVFGFFLIIEGSFLVAHSMNFFHGGHVPVTMGIVMFIIMTTWQWGRRQVGAAFAQFGKKKDLPMDMEWLLALKEHTQEVKMAQEQGLTEALRFLRQRSTVNELDRGFVFLTSQPIRKPDDRIPIILRTFVERYDALPSHIVLFHVAMSPHLPTVVPEQRFEVHDFGQGIISVIAHYGFMEIQSANVREDLEKLYRSEKIPLEGSHWMIASGEENILLTKDTPLLYRLRIHLFQWLLKFSTPAEKFFGLEGDAGLAKTQIPIRFQRDGVAYVDMPDLSIENGKGKH